MGGLFGGGHHTKPEYTGLATQTSSSSVAIPIAWGKPRVSDNIIWQGDFQSHKHSSGGKGGGGKGGGTYTYSASFEFALGWGPWTSVTTVYKNQSTTTLAAEGMTFFTGATPQSPWGYLTTNHPGDALGYAGIAYVAVANLDLGSSNSAPQYGFEVQAIRYNSASWTAGGDADIALVIEDFLSDPTIGVGFDMSFVDTTRLLSTGAATTTGDNAFQTYCRAMGYGFSPYLYNQNAAADTLKRWLDLTNTMAVWTGYSLKLIPRSAETITAHGVTYLPSFPVVYTIQSGTRNADVIGDASQDPVQFDRADPADCKNQFSITISNRANQYNDLPVTSYDQGLIDQYGANADSGIDAKEVCDIGMAETMVALIKQWNAYVRNSYKFKLGPDFICLEPGDVIEVLEPVLGTLTVMIEEITENDDDTLDVVAYEWNTSITMVPSTSTQAISNTPVNTNVAASTINPPILFEPPSSLSGTPQVWAAVSGGNGTTADPLWGGANVWISTDNTTYVQIGTISKPATQGVLTGSLASYGGANPDAGHTLAVSVAMSAGTLQSASSGADAAAGSTLCYVDGEFIGPQTATLTGANAYNLTNLYRGLYGSTAGSHSSATQFARLDDAIFKYALPAAYIGRTLYLKFQSFNVYGGGVQDLSTCTAYTYTPGGTAYGTGPGGVPSVPTGLAGFPYTGGFMDLFWIVAATSDNPILYNLYRANSHGASFGSATLVGQSVGNSLTDGTTTPSTDYTYFVTTTNAVGESAPSSGVNATTSAAVGPATPVSTQSGTTYTAVLADANTYIRFTNSSAVTFTIPPNSSVAFAINTVIEIEQAGTGALSVAAGLGVTINSRAADLTLAGQYAVAFLKKVATDTWTMNGDL